MKSYLTITLLGLFVLTTSTLAAAPARGPGRGPDAPARGPRAGALAQGAAAARAGRAQAVEARTEALEAAIDRREANQQRRIEAGIAKGQLTPAETTRLQQLETRITTMESTFKTDGKLTKDDAKQLREALNEASLQIWAERHDTEGNQKPASRLGKDIFAKDDLTAKIESGDFTKAQAREFLRDFHQLTTLKRRLATEALTPDQRAALQKDYDDLLNKYFIIK
jgi:hypothetical protein